LRFTAVTSHSYTVQFRAALPGASWTRLQDVVAGPGRAIEVKDPTPIGANQSRYYRLLTPVVP